MREQDGRAVEADTGQFRAEILPLVAELVADEAIFLEQILARLHVGFPFERRVKPGDERVLLAELRKFQCVEHHARSRRDRAVGMRPEAAGSRHAQIRRDEGFFCERLTQGQRPTRTFEQCAQDQLPVFRRNFLEIADQGGARRRIGHAAQLRDGRFLDPGAGAFRQERIDPRDDIAPERFDVHEAGQQGAAVLLLDFVVAKVRDQRRFDRAEVAGEFTALLVIRRRGKRRGAQGAVVRLEQLVETGLDIGRKRRRMIVEMFVERAERRQLELVRRPRSSAQVPQCPSG